MAPEEAGTAQHTLPVSQSRSAHVVVSSAQVTCDVHRTDRDLTVWTMPHYGALLSPSESA